MKNKTPKEKLTLFIFLAILVASIIGIYMDCKKLNSQIPIIEYNEISQTDSSEINLVEQNTKETDLYAILPDYETYMIQTTKNIVDDDDVLNKINTDILTKLKVSGRTAQNEDIVIVDYLVSSEANQNESQSNCEFQIGSNTMLEDFENSIIGMQENETKQFSLIYPDTIEDLAGTTAYITVRLKGIYVPVDYNSISDNDITAACGYKDKNELWAEVKSQLEQESENIYYSNVQDEIMSYLMSNSHIVSIPNDLIQSTKIHYEQYMDIISGTDSTYKDIQQNTNGLTDYEYNKLLLDESYEVVKKQIILKQFASIENIEVSDEEVTQNNNHIYTDMQFSSADEMLDVMGYEICEMYVLQNKITDWFLKNIN